VGPDDHLPGLKRFQSRTCHWLLYVPDDSTRNTSAHSGPLSDSMFATMPRSCQCHRERHHMISVSVSVSVSVVVLMTITTS
jgi:hypothetical protein